MPAPNDRRYTESHEWHKQDGDIITIGITQFAVDELTDITYVDLPAKGKQLAAGKPFGEIESVKATSELYSGIDGTVVAVNDEAIKNPALINQDPYGKGWMIKVKAPGAKLDDLMSAEDYNSKHG